MRQKKTSVELLDQPPPSAVESETALLSGFMVRGRVDPDCSLRPEQFYDVRNGAIYEVMIELEADAGGWDNPSLIARLQANKLWGKNGFDAAFVAEILYAAGNPAIGAYHSRKIKDAWRRRAIGEQALKLFQLSRNGFDVGTLHQSLDDIRLIGGDGDNSEKSRPAATLAPGTRVYAGDRGNIGEIVSDNGSTCTVHFVSPEGNTADKTLPKSQLRSLDGQPLDGEPEKPLPSPSPFRKLAETYPSLRQPVIEGLLRVGETANMVAAPKRGKSWLVNSLGLNVASGTKWLDTFSCTQGRVLILDGELHPEVIAYRLPVVANAMGIGYEFLDYIDVVPLRGCGADLLKLKPLIESVEPNYYSLVILDAWYRFLPLGFSENDNAQVMALYNMIDGFTSHLNAAWVNIHHTSKGDQSQKSTTDVGSGAGSQSRAADTHLVIRQHEQDDVAVIEAAVRSWPPVERLAIRWTFPIWQLDTAVDPRKLQKPRERSCREDKDIHLNEDRQGIVNVMVSATEPQTKTAIRDIARIGNPRFGYAWASLIADDTITDAGQVKRGNNRAYDGFILSHKETDE